MNQLHVIIYTEFRIKDKLEKCIIIMVSDKIEANMNAITFFDLYEQIHETFHIENVNILTILCIP